MRRSLLIFILFLTGFKSHAADTLINKLINSVYLEHVIPNAQYYLLLDTAENPVFGADDIKELKKQNEKIFDELPLNDFVSNIQHDVTKICWKDFNLPNAKCIDQQHKLKYSFGTRILRYMPYNTRDSVLQKLRNQNIIPVLIRPGSTKKQIQSAKQAAIREDMLRPSEDRSWYYFSKPIFSKNKDYVLISSRVSYSGCTYVFKLVNGSWIRVLKFKCWTS